MKSNFFHLLLVIFLLGFVTLGFQCGSPDFTGAKVQENNKNFAEAAKLYEKELQKNPANQEAWFRLGRIRGEQLNDITGMTAAFNEAQKFSNKFDNEIKAYRVQFWAQSVNNGVKYLKQASADSTEYYDKAIEEYKNAASILPDTSLTYHYLYLTYGAKGDAENMILNMNKEWELSHDLKVYKLIGQAHVQLGMDKKKQFDTTNTDQLKLQKNLNEADKGSYKSDIMRSLGAPDNIKKDKKNSKKEEWTYKQYGLVLGIEGERVTSKKITKKIDLKIDSTKYYEALVEFNQAVEVFEAIKKADPKDNENLNLLLKAYYEANRIDEAVNTFKFAVSNDPGNKTNHYILGILYRMINDYEGAIAEFTEALRIDPDYGDAVYDLGATYYNWGVRIKKNAQDKGDESAAYKKKFEEALPWIEKVTQLKNDDANVWQTLATIYTQLGQAEKAKKAFEEVDRIRQANK